VKTESLRHQLSTVYAVEVDIFCRWAGVSHSERPFSVLDTGGARPGWGGTSGAPTHALL